MWSFANVDMLEKRHWNRLESFFLDTYRDLKDCKDLKIVLTLNSDNKKRKFRFKSFTEDTEIDDKFYKKLFVNNKKDEKFVKHKNHIYHQDGDLKIKVKPIALKEFSVEEAVLFLRQNCERRFTFADFYDTDDPSTSPAESKTELIAKFLVNLFAPLYPHVLIRLAQTLSFE